jgi:hypothetical protein
MRRSAMKITKQVHILNLLCDLYKYYNEKKILILHLALICSIPLFSLSETYDHNNQTINFIKIWRIIKYVTLPKNRTENN